MGKIRVYAKGIDRKTRQGMAWLESQGLDFEIKNIDEDDFTYTDYLEVLSLTDSGVYDLVAKRSKEFDKLRKKVDVDSLTTSQFYTLMLTHTEIINQPIIIRDNKMSLGYKEEDISVFLPRSARGLSMDLGEYVKLKDSDIWTEPGVIDEDELELHDELDLFED